MFLCLRSVVWQRWAGNVNTPAYCNVRLWNGYKSAFDLTFRRESKPSWTKTAAGQDGKKMSEGLNEQKGGDSIISDLCSITRLQTNANCRDSSVNKQAPATGPLHHLNTHNNIYSFWDIKLQDKDSNISWTHVSYAAEVKRCWMLQAWNNKKKNTDVIMNSQ